MFRHHDFFDKCPLCKVFEISAPQQSGDLPHSHDYYQVWYVTKGCCMHDVEGQEYKMVVGDAFLLPSKVTHRTFLYDDSTIICCEFRMEMFQLSEFAESGYDQLREMSQGLSFTMLFQKELMNTQPKFTLSRASQRRVEYLMRTMLEEYKGGLTFYEDVLHLQILELLVTFAREYSHFPMKTESEKVYDKYRGMVEGAIQYIDQHSDEPLTLNSICKISMVSKTYFCYLFKLLTQQTFVEYLMNTRINKAMELLRQTDMPIIDISLNVGFHDSTHFSRTFKKLKGISPREYRSSNNKKKLR